MEITSTRMRTEVRRWTSFGARQWSLRWQSDQMSGPAFWYFPTEAAARLTERGLHIGETATESETDA